MSWTWCHQGPVKSTYFFTRKTFELTHCLLLFFLDGRRVQRCAWLMTTRGSWTLKKKNYLAHTHFKYFAHQTKSAVLKFHCPQVVHILIFFCCWRFQLKDHKVPATLVSEFFQVFFLSTLRSFKIKLSVRLFLPGRLNCNAKLVISSV